MKYLRGKPDTFQFYLKQVQQHDLVPAALQIPGTYISMVPVKNTAKIEIEKAYKVHKIS